MIANLSIIYKDINESCYSDDGKTLTKVNDTSPYLRISAKCEAIQDKCFYHLSSLISFSFEENPNLTKIRFSSFCECKNLTIINLSSCNKLATKYYTAFEFCYKVSEILLPNGLHEIQSSAFEYNTLLTSITIPASVEKIDKNAFSSCYRLSNVIFKEGSNLISLEYGVFWRTNIASFQIPEKVAYVNGYSFSTSTLKNLTIHPKNTFLKIGDNNTVFSANRSVLFFIGSKPIETYEIPDCVTTLGDYLFYQCNYKSIEIPNSVTTIGNGCFYNSNLKTIAFPCSLITIGEDSFSETKLVSIIIPESVKRIERAAFIFCHDLINVTLLGHIDFLGNQVFDYCKNLELIIFPNSTMIINYALCPVYSSPKLTMSFTYKTFFSTNTITTNTKVSISYLKESDLIINKYLLIMNSNMTIIYEYWCFDYVNSIRIPKSVKIIKERAFENSTFFQIEFEKDSQLSVIKNYAFRNCQSITSLIFSSCLSKVGIESFKDCKSLISISFNSTNLVVMNNAFENCIKLKNVKNILSIPDCCFSGCSKLSNVNILENSRFIGYKSFENCYSLESIIIPPSVVTLSEYSFLNCLNLKSIKFSERNEIEKISNNSFSGCISLQNISNFESDKCKWIDNTLYSIDNSKEYLVFHLNRSLDKTLIINCSVICSYAFNECNNIYNISILPKSVSLIEKYSFNNCKNLQHINFPFSVRSVEYHSFVECHSICCPLIIEDTKLDYLRMIVESGIPRRLILSCEIYDDTRDFETPCIYGIGAITFLLTSYF